MIRIPQCLMCIHFNKGKCLAYPEGIPENVFSILYNKEICANNVKYTRISKSGTKSGTVTNPNT